MPWGECVTTVESASTFKSHLPWRECVQRRLAEWLTPLRGVLAHWGGLLEKAGVEEIRAERRNLVVILFQISMKILGPLLDDLAAGCLPHLATMFHNHYIGVQKQNV